MVKAWKHATPAERREIVNTLAASVGVARAKAPAVKWRSADEIARLAG